MSLNTNISVIFSRTFYQGKILFVISSKQDFLSHLKADIKNEKEKAMAISLIKGLISNLEIA